MSNFNNLVLCCIAMMRALGTVLQVRQALGKQGTSSILSDLRATRRVTWLCAFRQNGQGRWQGLSFAVAQGCGGGGI